MNTFPPEQVLFIHARLIAETGGQHGVRDLDKLLLALGRVQASFDDKDLYPDLFTKATALMDSLIRNHPFLDGNKRTGVTAAGMLLLRKGFRLTVNSENLVDMTLRVARSQTEVDELAPWLEQSCDPIP